MNDMHKEWRKLPMIQKILAVVIGLAAILAIVFLCLCLLCLPAILLICGVDLISQLIQGKDLIGVSFTSIVGVTLVLMVLRSVFGR